MRRNRKDHTQEATSAIVTSQSDSPTILNLIEQLERDLKESERKATKTQ